MIPSIAEAGRQLRAGTTTSVKLTQQALAAATATQPLLHAFITLTAERALADAARADAAFAAGTDAGPLQGVPYALKDIYDTAGILTTCHSRLRQDVVPEADCVVAARLAAAGGVLIGKLATHEFAIGGPSFDLPWPPARNPWNTAHFTAGSSSGSGAAVAAGVGPDGDGVRHRRLDPRPGGLLRHRRAEAQLRPGEPPRRVPAELHARPLRPADPQRRGHGDHPAADRRA